jgi:SAM-dependent methyltransferase
LRTESLIRAGASEEPGIRGPLQEWLDLNASLATDPSGAQGLISPFPPPGLMMNTTGLERPEDFAAHGIHIAQKLADISPTPLRDFTSFLDFGVGVGRLARMFKGFAGRYVGVDVDGDNIEWISKNLPHVEAVKTRPREPLPFANAAFDAIAAVSVFTHMTEADHIFYLRELKRVARPGASLFITVHGDRALRRTESEQAIFTLLNISAASVADARKSFDEGVGFDFTLQNGHLTSVTAPENPKRGFLNKLFGLRNDTQGITSEKKLDENFDYQYGITFIDANYIRNIWAEYFDVVSVTSGAIHDFQDLVLLRRHLG